MPDSLINNPPTCVATLRRCPPSPVEVSAMAGMRNCPWVCVSTPKLAASSSPRSTSEMASSSTTYKRLRLAAKRRRPCTASEQRSSGQRNSGSVCQASPRPRQQQAGAAAAVDGARGRINAQGRDDAVGRAVDRPPAGAIEAPDLAVPPCGVDLAGLNRHDGLEALGVTLPKRRQGRRGPRPIGRTRSAGRPGAACPRR